jgi:tRNA(Ser,Leu) C12 N-acetylase TAN1
MNSSTTTSTNNKQSNNNTKTNNATRKQHNKTYYKRMKIEQERSGNNKLKGSSGILVTTLRGREKIGGISICKAISNIMTTTTTTTTTSSATNNSNSIKTIENMSMDELVQAEILAEKQANNHLENSVISFDNVECVVLVSDVKDSLNVVLTICEEVVQQKNLLACKFVQRLSPLQLICHASLDGIEKAFKPFLEDFEVNNDDDDNNDQSNNNWSFCIVARVRSTNLNRSDVINTMAKCVDQTKHPVKLDNPDIVIGVEVCQNVAGFFIVQHNIFTSTCKFNLQELIKKTNFNENVDGGTTTTTTPPIDTKSTSKNNDEEDNE